MDCIAWVDGFSNAANLAYAIGTDHAVKGSAIVLVTAIVALAMHRSSASVRHLTWFAGVICAGVLPIVGAALPAWQVMPPWKASLLPTESDRIVDHGMIASHVAMDAPAAPRTVGSNAVPLVSEPSALVIAPSNVVEAPRALTTVEWIFISWLAGVGGLMVCLFSGYLSLRRLRKRIVPVTDFTLLRLLAECCDAAKVRRRVDLFIGTDRPMPMTWGIVRPSLLLPDAALGWSLHQCRAVIMHELAHVKRNDCLAQLITQIICACCWFNPLMWYAQLRMKVEREQSCDDLVLRNQVRPSDYAQHLVDVARESHRPFFVSSVGIAMARSSRLKGRVAAILDTRRNRRSVRARVAVTIVLLLAGITIPVTIAQERQPATAPSTTPARDPVPVADLGPEPPVAYSFRSPGYSLRDEPQRVAPRTLGHDRVAPEDAIVLNWPIRWWSSHWSSSLNTSSAAMDMLQGHPRMTVLAPGKYKIWVKYLDMFIDPERYPLLVLTYRAENVLADGTGYALYLDDGSGPDYGGLLPVSQRDLIADGNRHTLTVDLRTMKPIGKIIGLAVGLQSANELASPAVLELIDIRFESITSQKIHRDGRRVTVQVRDSNGLLVDGAVVTVNAERKNWADVFTTDASGKVVVDLGLSDDDYRHMLRIEADGKLPVEIRDIAADRRLVDVTLADAVPYEGRVVDVDGRPLSGVAVRVQSSASPSQDVWTRRDAEAITDVNGAWSTLPMDARDEQVQVSLSHPSYDLNSPAETITAPARRFDSRVLKSVPSEIKFSPGVAQQKLSIVDEAGEPIQTRVIAQGDRDDVAQVTRDGTVSVRVRRAPPSRATIIAEGYVPRMATLPNVLPSDEAVPVTLYRGNTYKLRIEDHTGKPLAGDFVIINRFGDVNIARLAGENLIGRQWLKRIDDEGYITVQASEMPLPLTLNITSSNSERKAARINFTMTGNDDTVRLPSPDNPENSPRREGYDPERIFRRIS